MKLLGKFLVNFLAIFFILFTPLGLMSCSFSKAAFSQNNNRSYLSAKAIPPLKIPPGLSSDTFHTAYPVSDRQYSVLTEDVNIYPPGLDKPISKV